MAFKRPVGDKEGGGEVVSSRGVRDRDPNSSSKAEYSRLASLSLEARRDDAGFAVRTQVGLRVRRKRQSSGNCIP